MNQHLEQEQINRIVHQEIYLNMSVLVSELMSKTPAFIDEFPDLIDGYVENENENEDGEEEYLEIFEYWAVSDWLADKLILRGERVEKDFYGHCIWGRTTCGQAISMDEVIKRIACA